MDDFEAFRQKKLGKGKPAKADGAAPADEFEAFRKKKLESKQQDRSRANAEAMKGMSTFAVEEEGKAKGLVSHRARLGKVSKEELPEVKGFDSHISRAEVDPESVEKFRGKGVWHDNRIEADPDSVPKVKTTSHISKAKKIDPDSIDKPPGIKRF